MGIRDDYKNTWANEQLKYSNHPLEFWLEIITMVIEGRQSLQADQLNPMGKRWDQAHWQNYLEIVLQTGLELENTKGIESAFVMYEVCVAELYNHDEPYDKLRVFYQEKKWFGDAMRIANARLDASFPFGAEKPKIKVSGFKIERKPVLKKPKR